MGLRDWFRPGPVPLTAAVVSVASSLDDDRRRETRQATEAWEVWRCVGEIHYVTTQQARLVGRLEWKITIDGNELEPEQADELLRTVFGDRLRDLQVNAALHLQVPGGYILARVEDQWGIYPDPPDHKAKKKLDRADILVTVENPDPRDPGRLDSPVLASLDVARELILTRAQARAAARSRTAQLNTLLYPLEGAGPDTKSFEKRMMDVMVAPLSDERSTASVVPNLIGFPAEHIDKWKTLDLTGPIDEKLHVRIERLVNQLAMMLDIPPEILLGMSDVNHWTGWLLQEDNWLGHVEPLAAPIGQGMARALQQVAGTEAEILVEPDPANLLKRRPAIADVLQAFQLGLVSDTWAREQIGAPESEAGEPQEEPETDEVIEVESTEEPEPPAIAAAGRLPVDAVRLTEIDLQAFETMQDLIQDTAARVLERVGARLRSAAQGRDAEVLSSRTNTELAIGYTGQIPNLEAIAAEVARSAAPKVDRIVHRAFRHVRMAGVPIDPDPADLDGAREMFVSAVAFQVRVLMAKQTGVAESWVSARRVVAEAGGQPDPAPVTAASGLGSTPRGIALGVRAMEAVQAEYGLISDEWRWYHAYRGDHPHPEHKALDGRTFAPGGSILEGGINWFPGDHAGCQCLATPVFRSLA